MIGFGYDIHQLAIGETLILGGILIESEVGTVAHSDGDVLLHAVCDALLGAAGLGDIGEHFPDTDSKWKDASSITLLSDVLAKIANEQLRIVNLDMTLVLEKPKIGSYKNAIRENIAGVCNLPVQRVNIKATTSEKIGAIGRGEGVQAYCVCQLQEV